MRITDPPNQMSSFAMRPQSNHSPPGRLPRRADVSTLVSAVVSTLVATVLLLALAGCTPTPVDHAPKPADQAAQKAVVQEFFDLVVAANIYGLPSDTELVRLTPFMSANLASLFKQARVQQAADYDRHQGTEPPLVQGSPFVSLFEGATEVQAIAPGEEPHKWAVELTYERGSDPVQWTDQASVVLEQGRWVVSDVTFGGQWDFARRGNLSDMLKSVQAAQP